ncbi:diguanylate cyclase (GGDEF)-like protein [Labrenzia sp. EL_13]|nr:diguanylate cyclase (GGDEF)-like protein [Labrenzia sp. EL_142]MBG6200931.1 diguanylate cyclase (GGDEF)-like protein [Labrenzia sp. EL_13]
MSEFRRRHSDQAPKLAKQHISRLAFMLAGLLIAVTSISLMFVGFIATRASTQQTIANEERLFQSVVSDRLRAIVREQIRITSSDTSVENLVRGFNPAFARQSFDTLWTDYRHDKIMLISGDKKVLAESFEDYTHIIKRPLDETPELEIIVQKLTAKYMRNRVRVPGGFGYRSLLDIDPKDYALMGYVRIDGKPAIFGAMPVIPDKFHTTLPDGPPTILLSALYIDETLQKQLNSQLDFTSFAFIDTVSADYDGPIHPVSDQTDIPLGAFRWESESASTSIWPTIIPVIAILSVALGALAFGIAWRIGLLTTSLQVSEQQNRYLALHDTLSGLGNRLLFNRVLDTSVKELPEKHFAVLHCDLDKFKSVNDTFGHAAGDEVIRVVAHRMQETVGRQGLVCRIGGDEFMVIYRKETAKTQLQTLCRTLVASAQEPISCGDGTTVSVGLSIGIACAPEDGSEGEQLVSRSDAALYRSKAMGRSQFTFFSDIPTRGADECKSSAPDKAGHVETYSKAAG